jgi:antitoxin PrlF
MNAVVSEKGQVTIPKALREKLGLSPGTVVEFEAEQGQLVGRKRVQQDVFAKWRGQGQLPRGLSVDEYLRQARDGNRS